MVDPGTVQNIELKRPVILTVICVVLFLTSMMAMQLFTSGEFSSFPQMFRYIYLGMILLTVVSVFGIFLMRKWGVILFALVTVAGQSAQLWFGSLNPIYLALMVVIMLVCFGYFRRMR